MSKFTKEVDLCAALKAEVDRVNARRQRWTFYPETCGFDVVLVRDADGVQIGIEAKLRLNAKVLCQALPPIGSWAAAEPGPDFRAVLVPADARQAHIDELATRLGVHVIAWKQNEWSRIPNWLEYDEFGQWPAWYPAKRLTMPDYIPRVVAGDKAPIRLTPWTIKALKVLVILDRREVVREDFRHLAIDPSRWIGRDGWLVRGRNGWTKGPYTPDLARPHPEVFAEIAADYPKWAPLEPAVTGQAPLDLGRTG